MMMREKIGGCLSSLLLSAYYYFQISISIYLMLSYIMIIRGMHTHEKVSISKDVETVNNKKQDH